ncbi:hypothetical protein [Microbacterium sp. 3J1]|uniref:hypothetical protein n=1 Tax=Microbacterium sp. 3J1 TaxID=861269 RepID=UPI000B89B108|nr:hypothetical protein [Microbacterium sp. 3J1]
MRAARTTLVLIGILLLGCGGWWLLTRQDVPQLIGVLVWLIAVVVIHDGFLVVVSAVRHRLRRSEPTLDADEGSP